MLACLDGVLAIALGFQLARADEQSSLAARLFLIALATNGVGGVCLIARARCGVWFVLIGSVTLTALAILALPAAARAGNLVELGRFALRIVVSGYVAVALIRRMRDRGG